MFCTDSVRRVASVGTAVPDGVADDAQAGRICWTNMVVPSANDCAIERVDLDGADRTTPEGGSA
jgi:hypothetical protein